LRRAHVLIFLLAVLCFVWASAAHGQTPIEPVYTNDGPGWFRNCYASGTPVPSRDVTLWLGLGVAHTPTLSGQTMGDAIAGAAIDFGRVSRWRFVVVPVESQAFIRVRVVPWGHAILQGHAAYSYNRGKHWDVYLPATYAGNAKWLPEHIRGLARHEFTHPLGLPHGPAGVRGATNPSGLYLAPSYHNSDALIPVLGLAGFNQREIGQLQSRAGGPPHPIYRNR
jgi:hypothetical protein